MTINKETNVTIISTDLDYNLVNNFLDYYVIDKPFKIEEIKKHDKILFFNSLHYIDNKSLDIIIKYLKETNKKFIIVTNNMEEVLLADYLIVVDNEKILIEGKTLAVLSESKLLKRLGFNLPFTVQISQLLNDYDILDGIYTSNEELVEKIWN